MVGRGKRGPMELWILQVEDLLESLRRARRIFLQTSTDTAEPVWRLAIHVSVVANKSPGNMVAAPGSHSSTTQVLAQRSCSSCRSIPARLARCLAAPFPNAATISAVSVRSGTGPIVCSRQKPNVSAST